MLWDPGSGCCSTGIYVLSGRFPVTGMGNIIICNNEEQNSTFTPETGAWYFQRSCTQVEETFIWSHQADHVRFQLRWWQDSHTIPCHLPKELSLFTTDIKLCLDPNPDYNRCFSTFFFKISFCKRLLLELSSSLREHAEGFLSPSVLQPCITLCPKHFKLGGLWTCSHGVCYHCTLK